MNDNWLKDIHDKMSDFEIEEPQGLWDSIDLTSLNNSGEDTSKPAGKRTVYPWKILITAAAIVAVAILTVSLIYIENPTIEINEIPGNDTLFSEKIEKRDIVPDNETETGSESQVIINSYGISTSPSTSEQIDLIQEMTKSNTVDLLSENKSDIDSIVSDKSHKDSIINLKPKNTYKKESNNYNRNLIALNTSTDNKTGKISVGIYSSGGTGSEINRKSSSFITASGIGPDNYSWKDTPVLGILAFNKGREITSDIKHHLPVRTGLSFSYRLNNRLGLTSGISYTKLASDIYEGTENHYFSGRQNLHYIGIPVNVTYNIASWSNLDFYASGGVMGEKCVSGSVKKTYVLDNKVVDRERQKIEEKPFQWSVNASTGVQYNISSFIGVYAEPGISYYFDDNTELKTIYKDKPLNFNLNLGIRLTIGN